jgi:hypothetical protein
MDNDPNIELLYLVNSVDLEALQDAQFTLQAIKESDPGTYDEIINQSLMLIEKALGISCMDAIETISEQLKVKNG